jgi:hypothetical protein
MDEFAKQIIKDERENIDRVDFHKGFILAHGNYYYCAIYNG